MPGDADPRVGQQFLGEFRQTIFMYGSGIFAQMYMRPSGCRPSSLPHAGLDHHVAALFVLLADFFHAILGAFSAAMRPPGSA